MARVRSAYGRLIRTPVMGPFARLPLRLARWFLQHPDSDPSTRLQSVTAELRRAQAEIDRLAASHESLARRHEHLRLTSAMLSAMVAPSPEPSAAAFDRRWPQDERLRTCQLS